MLGDLVDVAVLVFVLVLGILWMSLWEIRLRTVLWMPLIGCCDFGIEAQV